VSVSRRIDLLCAWSGAAFLVTYLAFFAGIAGWIPPIAPGHDAAYVAAQFHENSTRIRVGQVGAMICSFLLLPLWALISAYIARVERALGRFPVMAIVQFGCAVILQVFFVLCSMLWLVGTFRDGLSPEVVQVINDAGWLIFVMVFPGYLFQMLCIGIAALMDPSPRPIIPRWAAYLHLWVGISGTGGGLAVFFKYGPFAWNGIVGFWIPVVVFAIWLSVITWLLHRGVVTDQFTETGFAADDSADTLQNAGS
jgi:hypothetical protein